MFVIFAAPMLLYTQSSVQCNGYIIDNGTEKQIQAYFVRFYLYRNIMHVVHVSG